PVGGTLASNYNLPTTASGAGQITSATSSTAIDCSPGSFTYTGSAITPCTATVTRVGEPNTTATVTYTNNTNVGTATADASYAGDANHTGSTATQVTFEITKYVFSVCDQVNNNICTGGTTPSTEGVGGLLTITSSVSYGGSATASVNLSPASLGGVDVLTTPGTDPDPLSNPPPSFKVWIA